MLRTAIFLLALLASPALADASLTPAQAIGKFDTDHDGKLSWAEVMTAAKSAYRKAHGSVPDAAEGHLYVLPSGGSVWETDPGISLSQYLALAHRSFNGADTDWNGKLTQQEMSGPWGRALLNML